MAKLIIDGQEIEVTFSAGEPIDIPDDVPTITATCDLSALDPEASIPVTCSEFYLFDGMKYTRLPPHVEEWLFSHVTFNADGTVEVKEQAIPVEVSEVVLSEEVG